MSSEFNPYLQWLGIRETQRPINHYRLLGLELFEADANVISMAADRQMAHLRTFQAGAHGELVQQLLNEISTAKISLLKPERKAAYDAQLKAKLAPARPAAPVAAAPVAIARAVAAPVANPGMPRVVAPSSSAVKIPARPKNRWTPWAILAGLVVLCGVLIMVLINNNKPNPEPIATDDPASSKTGKQGKIGDTQLTSTKNPTGIHDNPAVETNPGKKATPTSVGETGKNPPPVKPKNPPTDTKQVAVKTPTPPVYDPKAAKQIRNTVDTIVANAAHAFGEELPMTVAATDPVVAVEPMPAAAPALPDKAAIAAKSKEIREIFKDKFASRKPEDRLALAKELWDNSQQPQDDRLTKMVLLQEARDLALTAGEAEVALQSTKQLCSEFQEELSESMLTAFSKLNLITGRPATYYQYLLGQAATFMTELKSQEEYDAALRLANMSQVLARRLNDQASVLQLTNHIKELTQLKTLFAKARSAREALKENPQDPAANLTWGEFLCFTKNDFDAGLKLLAKGSDADLKALAQRDLANPQEPDKIVALADEWWNAADREKDRVRLAMRGRSIMQYEKLQGKLTGLAATKVEKRIKDGNAELASSGGNQDSEWRRMLLATPWNITWKGGNKDIIKFKPDGTSENHTFVVWDLLGGELTVRSSPQNPAKSFVKIRMVNGQYQAIFQDVVSGRTDTGIATPSK